MDIMACILNEAIKGAKKTRLMYRCNLSYRQLQAYLKLLLSMEMLKLTSREGSNTTDFFKTSAKGYEFLDAYHNLKTLMA